MQYLSVRILWLSQAKSWGLLLLSKTVCVYYETKFVDQKFRKKYALCINTYMPYAYGMQNDAT